MSVFLAHRPVTDELLSNNGAIGRFPPGEDVESTFEERDEVRVAYQHEGTYTFEFSLRNNSRWAVRVVGFPVTPDLRLELSEEEIDAMRSSSTPTWATRPSAPTLPRECRVEDSWVYQPAEPALLLADSETPADVSKTTDQAADAIPDAWRRAGS